MIYFIRRVDFAVTFVLFNLYCSHFVEAADDLSKMEIIIQNKLNFNSNKLHGIESRELDRDSYVGAKMRVKRQGSGAGKYTEAARTDETKLMQIIVQMFANLFASTYVGGGHPLHPDVPKPMIILFKEKVLNFLSPKKKDSELES